MTRMLHKVGQGSPQLRPCIHTTLLDLVWAINQATENDQQTVAMVVQLVNSGRAKLVGTFKDTRQLSV